MTLDSIRKRNNELVPLTALVSKTLSSRLASLSATTISPLSLRLRLIILALQTRFGGTEYVPSVEDIQDAVELHLMRSGRYEVAKEYITYRQKRIEEKWNRRRKNRKTRTQVKRDGKVEAFDMSKVRRVFELAANGHPAIDLDLLVSNFHTNIFDGIHSRDIAQATIMTAKLYRAWSSVFIPRCEALSHELLQRTHRFFWYEKLWIYQVLPWSI